MPTNPTADPNAWFESYFVSNPSHSIDQAVAAFDEQNAPKDERTFLGRAADAVVPPVLRVGSAIAGGVIGAPAGPAGIVAGGAVGSGAGELAAEGYEKLRGRRTKINPAQIVVQSALGAIPLGGRAATIARTVGRRAVQGGVMGGASSALTQVAEGERPAGDDILRGAALGAVVGAGGGRLEAALARKTSATKANLPRLEALEQARQVVASPSVVDRLTEIPRTVNRALLDQFTDVRDFVAKGEKSGQFSVRPEADPRNIVDLVYGGTTGRTENAFRNFRQVVKEAEDAGLDTALRQFLDLKGLSRGAHTLNTHAQEALAKGDVDLATDIYMRLHAGESLPVGYTPADLTNDLASFETQLGPKFRDVERLGQKVFDLNRKALDIVHDAGVVSDDVYTKLASRGSDYIPLTRILDSVLDAQTQSRASSLSLKQQKVLFELEGSKRATEDPIRASMSRMQEAIREAGRNEAAKSIVDLAQVHPVFANQILEVAPGAKAPKGFGTIGVFENGKKRTFAVPDDVATAMNLAEYPEVRLVGSTMLAFTRNVLQKMATGANLAFSVPNVIRDVSDARKLSNAYKPYNPKDLASFMGEWASALKQRMTADPEYRAFLESRAGYSTLQKAISPEQFLHPGSGLNPLNAIADVNSVLEESTKLTTFKRLKEQGKSDVVAAIETRRFGGSPDFARRGTMSPELNLLLMFFNASAQGVARTLTRLNPVTNPGRFATLLGGATMSAMALDRWNARFTDPDGTPSIDRISNADKKNNFVIVRPETYRTSEGVERHRYYKLPKGHVAKLVFTPIEETLRPSEGGASQAVLDTISNLSPVNVDIKKNEPLASIGRGVVSSLNPALKAPLEQLIGEGGLDTFRNAPIVPRRLLDVDPNEQFTEATSPTIVKGVRGVNRALGTRLSPMRTEAFLRNGPLVGPGESVLSLVDDLVAPADTSKLEGDEAAAKAPILGPILRRFVGTSVDQTERDTLDEFYRLYADATSAKRTLSDLAKRNPAEAQAFFKDPERQRLIGLEPTLRQLGQGFANIRNARQIDSRPEVLAKLGGAEQQLVAQTRIVLDRIKGLSQPNAAPRRLRKSTIDALYERYLRQAEAQ